MGNLGVILKEISAVYTEGLHLNFQLLLIHVTMCLPL